MSEITETFINSSNGINSFDVQQSTGVTNNNNQPVTKVNSRTGGLDTVLSEEQIAQLGFIKVDTNTQLTDAQIEALGYVKTDNNTQLSDADILALGYRKIDPDFTPDISNQSFSADESTIFNYNIVNTGVSPDQVKALALPSWMNITSNSAGYRVTGTMPSFQGNANDVLTIAFKASTIEGGSINFNITATTVEVSYVNDYSYEFNGTSVGMFGPNRVEGDASNIDAFDDNNAPFTMSMWFKPLAGNTNQTLFYTGSSTITDFNGAVFIKTINEEQVEAFYGDNSDSQTILTSSSTLNFNDWNFIVLMWDSVDLKLYINGADEHTGNKTTVGNGGETSSIGTSELSWISGPSDSNGTDGRLNQIAIWPNEEFGTSDLSSMYNSGVAQDLTVFQYPPSHLWEPELSSTSFNTITGSDDLTISGIDDFIDIYEDSPA